MVDVWTEEDFPDYVQMDWWISIPLWNIGTMCLIVGVDVVAIIMFGFALAFLFGTKLPVYLIEEYDENEVTDTRLVGGLDILRLRKYYHDILISGPYWGEELELMRMDFEED